MHGHCREQSSGRGGTYGCVYIIKFNTGALFEAYMLSDSNRLRQRWRSRPSSTVPPERACRVRCGPGREGVPWGMKYELGGRKLYTVSVFPALTSLPHPCDLISHFPTHCQVRTNSGILLTKGQAPPTPCDHSLPCTPPAPSGADEQRHVPRQGPGRHSQVDREARRTSDHDTSR